MRFTRPRHDREMVSEVQRREDFSEKRKKRGMRGGGENSRTREPQYDVPTRRLLLLLKRLDRDDFYFVRIDASCRSEPFSEFFLQELDEGWSIYR